MEIQHYLTTSIKYESMEPDGESSCLAGEAFLEGFAPVQTKVQPPPSANLSFVLQMDM